MTAAALSAAARAHGATLQAVAGRLRIRAPRPLPDDVLGALREHKAEVVAALSDAKAKVPHRTKMPNLQELGILGKPCGTAGFAEIDAAKVPFPPEWSNLGQDNAATPGATDANAYAEAPPVDWAAWYRAEVARRTTRRRTHPEAERRVWGIALCLWHRHHRARPGGQQCAGCGGPLPAHAWALPDGARIHDGARAIECLAAYGAIWRTKAAAALKGAGVPEPSDDNPYIGSRGINGLTRL